MQLNSLMRCLTAMLVLSMASLALPAQEVSEKFMETYRAYDKAYKEGDIAKAYELAVETLRLGREELGPDHEKTAVLEINLAHILTLAGHFKEAESIFINARKTLEMLKDEHDPVFFTIHDDLGEIHTLQGRYGEARQDFLNAIQVVATDRGSDHPDVAELLLKQAAAEGGVGDLAAARSALNRALDIRKAAFGARDFRSADVVFQTGILDGREKDYQAAIKSFHSALLIYEQTLEPNNPRIIKVHSELATLYEVMGDPKKYTYHSDKVVSLIPDTEGDAQALIIVQPKYPKLPESAAREGWLLLEYTVNEQGRVQSPKVIEGSNQAPFTKAAIAVTDKWRFKPRVVDGKRTTQPNMRARMTFTPENIDITIGKVD